MIFLAVSDYKGVVIYDEKILGILMLIKKNVNDCGHNGNHNNDDNDDGDHSKAKQQQ